MSKVQVSMKVNGKTVDALEHILCEHGWGEVVIFVAVFAGQVATADGDDVRGDRMPGRG